MNILFPELETIVPTLHMASVYALLSEFPGAQQIADTHLTHLKTLLDDASKGRYDREKAVEIREAARRSIGSRMPAKSLELRHTIQLIRELDKEIAEVEDSIEEIMNSIQSPITTIPGMGLRMGAMILAEVGDFANFDSPDKILAYAGLSPSTYESESCLLPGLTPIWRNADLATFVTLSSTQRNMSAIGTRPSPPTLPRSAPRANTTTSPSLMQLRSS